MIQNCCDAVHLPMLTQSSRAGKLVNQTLLELCSTLRLAQPLLSLVVTPGVGDYSIASGLGVSNAVQVRDIYYQPVGQTQPGPVLERTSPSRIDEIRARQLSNTYPMLYAVAGVDQLMLAPVPADAGTLSVRVVADGDQLAADSDSPLTLPAEFHDVVWRGAAVQLAEIRRPELVAALAARQTMRIGDLRSWLVDMGGAKPMRMQRQGNTVPNRDPSIYPVIQSQL